MSKKCHGVTEYSELGIRNWILDAGYWMLDGRDLFPLRKEPVLSEAEGGLGGLF
jgi:hypothetical protein